MKAQGFQKYTCLVIEMFSFTYKMNFWSIFHNKKSATGCCEVGPTDDWKNAKSAPELSRVLRRIYLLPSWKYLTSLRSNIILKLLVGIHVVQQIYLAATVCLWGLNRRESASSAAVETSFRMDSSSSMGDIFYIAVL